MNEFGAHKIEIFSKTAWLKFVKFDFFYDKPMDKLKRMSWTKG